MTAAQLRQNTTSCKLFGTVVYSTAFLMYDLMHISELGVVLHIIANILFSIVYVDGARTDKEAQFDRVWAEILAKYKSLRLKHKLTKLHLRQICDTRAPHADFPVLKQVKAAEAKHLLRAVAAVALDHNSGSDIHTHRARVASSLVEVYDIVESSGHFISNTAEFKAAASRFQIHYQWLAKRALQDGKKMWSVVNKFHHFEHMIAQGVFENPALFWAYSGEDFVGRISRLGHMCLTGKPSYAMSPVLVDRYLIGFHLRLVRLQED